MTFKRVKTYVNPGLDTVNLAVPKADKPLTRAQGRLQIHNEVIPIDDTIESFTRTKKVPYKQIEYKKKFIPPEFKNPTPVVRRSERITPVATCPTTRWTASKTIKVMNVNASPIPWAMPIHLPDLSLEEGQSLSWSKNNTGW